MSDQIQEQVKEAQRNILAHLASYEMAMAELYAAFAECIPEHRMAWEKMAEEERGHARMVSGLDAFLARGFLFHNIGRFDVGTMDDHVRAMEQFRKASLMDGIDISKAGKIALEAEASILEGGFYQVVESDSREFQIMAKHLSDSTTKHVDRLREMLSSAGPNRSPPCE
ncbi:MAG: hypothetical protein WCL44_02750 [bacterium]